MGSVRNFIALGLVSLQLMPIGYASTPVAPSPDFSARWAVSPLGTKHGRWGDYEWRTYIRILQAGARSFSIGNIIYLKLPKPAGVSPRTLKEAGLTPAGMAEVLREGLGIPEWRVRRVSKAWVFESEWKSHHRYVRLFVKDEAHSLAYSIALFRTAYAARVALESEMMQRQIHGLVRQSEPWLEKMVSFFPACTPAYAGGDDCRSCKQLSPELQAYCYLTCSISNGSSGGSTTGTAIGIGIGGSGSSTGSSTNDPFGIQPFTQQLSRFNDQLPAVLGNWSATNSNWAQTNSILNTQLPVLNTTLEQTNAAIQGATQAGNRIADQIDQYAPQLIDTGKKIGDQIGSMASSLSGIQQSIDEQGPAFNKTAQQAIQVADKQATAFNQSLSRAVDLLESAAKPGNFVKYVAAYKATSMLTGMAVGLIVSKIGAGLKFLFGLIHDKITGKSKDDAQVTISQFREALKVYDEASKNIAALETSIDKLLAVYGNSGQLKIPNEDLLAKLRPALNSARNHEQVYNENAREAIRAGDDICEAQWNQKAVLAQAQEKEITDLMTVLQDNPASNACQSIEAGLEQISEAEWLREGAFADIGAAENMWYQALDTRQKQIRNNFKKARDYDEVGAGRKLLGEIADEQRSGTAQDTNDIRDNLVKACKHALESAEKDMPGFLLKDQCNQAYQLSDQDMGEFLRSYVPELYQSGNEKALAQVQEELRPIFGQAKQQRQAMTQAQQAEDDIRDLARENFASRVKSLSNQRPDPRAFSGTLRRYAEMFDQMRDRQSELWTHLDSLLAKGRDLARACKQAM